MLVNTDASTADLQDRYPQYQDKIHLLWNGYGIPRKTCIPCR